MKRHHIYLNDWLEIHPYTAVQPSDAYFVDLARRLYEACRLPVPEPYRIKLSLYAAAYLEDRISGLNLWKSFTSEHKRLYGSYLPFYDTGAGYLPDEINPEDLRFIVWNTWQKAHYRHEYVYPMRAEIQQTALAFYEIIDRAYEEAPANDALEGLFDGFEAPAEADRKLSWLFGHSYLTEPSMGPYIKQVTPGDRFIIPTGPLALFLKEWIPLLTSDISCWKQIAALYTPEPEIPEEMKRRNRETYDRFVAATEGERVVFIDGYPSLKDFLVKSLGWADDENHTLPHLQNHRDFILMTEPEKGILLAKDICSYVAAPKNPLYRQEEAQRQAFRLLTEEMLCPPDLLTYCIENGFLPDAAFPETEDTSLVQRNADFIARHSLLYYYRGD